MSTGEQPSPLKSKKLSSSSSQTRNDSENPWLVIPNNLELGARAKPSKKLRNKEKHRQFQQGNLSSPSEVTDSLSCKPKPSFHSFPEAKSNTAIWVKDQYVKGMKSTRRTCESEGDYSDAGFPHFHQQNVHFPANQPFSDVEHQEGLTHPLQVGGENENIKSVQGEFKKKEDAMVSEIMNHIHEFISEAESSWQKLNLSDEPVIKNAFVKLKKAVEGDRESKVLHHSATENGYDSVQSPSSSISRNSNSKENIVNRDISGMPIQCNDGEQDKYNHHHEVKIPQEKAGSITSDDCSIHDARERVAKVEWERRTIKNKLVQLQEEKKKKDALLRELISLKEANKAASATGTSAKQPKAKERKRKKLSRLPCTSMHLKQPKGSPAENGSNMASTSDTSLLPDSRHDLITRQCHHNSNKRDNVRKEQNSSFPARRHYEAEGRANEEPDIPVGPAPAVSPAIDNGDIQYKIRTLADWYFSEESVEDDDDDDDDNNKEFTSTLCVSSSEPTATNVKEVYHDNKCVDRHEESEEAVADNLETTVAIKEDLSKLHSQFHQLMQIFPRSDSKNDDPVRSSGEGAYTLRKIPTRNVVSEHAQKKHSLRPVPHQDNLQLTRQNIATMESQNQNSNLHNRDCNSIKKDNINNLSGKMGKLSIQNPMNSSYPDVLAASNNNMDSTSVFSYELNQSHSVPNEVERKNIFDILKRDKKKQKQYDRNQDNKICCNSSFDSEPFEGSTSALAFDSTTLGAWGGSSTQENFHDDNREHGESEEQDDEEENVSVFEKISPRVHSQYSGQYSNMQQYIDSVGNIPEKKERNLHHPSYNRNQNQSDVQGGFHQKSPQEVKTAKQRMSSASAVRGSSRDMHDNAACSNDPAESQQFSSKFIQQLLSHVDQLNALCQNQIYNERPPASFNSLLSQGYGHIPNTCAPLQPSLEIPLSYNQQLLFYLSQCYHALYIQQLEINHLQRCVMQAIEGENHHQQNYFNSRSGPEDVSFRPYCAPSLSNPFIPSNHLFPEQASSVSSAPYFHLPMKHCTNNNTGTYTGSGPARAVIHPTSQNNTASQETLNNQVPPRTRVNNFWDNFRSYSRQNLLSTSNTAKRNENVASVVTPQVRHVYPLVNNESLNRSTDVPNACCISSSCPDYNRASPNFEDTTTKNMKFNTAAGGAIGSSKKDVPINVNSIRSLNVRSRPYRANLETPLVPPTSNYSSNLSQQQSLLEENSKPGSLNTDASNSISCPVQEVAATATNPTAEISSTLPSDHKSDFLIGLLHEAQVLKSEALRQKALKIIRDLALSELHDNHEASQHKVQNDSTSSVAELQKSPASMSNQHCSKISSESIAPLSDAEAYENLHFQLLFENTSENIQVLPTAAIPPLSKHGMPKAISTGAVRKKSKVPSGNLSEYASNEVASLHDSGSSTADSTNLPTALPPNKTIEDIPGFITDKVIADLSAVLPSLKKRLLRDGCTQTFWTFINDCLLESLRTHLFFCNINLPRRSLLHLRQTVYLFLTLFSELTFTDMDSDFVKYVEEFIYENVNCYITNGRFAAVPSSLDEENCHMGMEDETLELCVKMPSDPAEQVSIKMPLRIHEDSIEPLNVKMPLKLQEESVESITMKESPVPSEENNFSPRCAPVHLQNILSLENFIPEALALPIEQDACGYNPEAEIEPEVETGTEADLAEADQSPGQQSSVVGENVPLPENWSLDHEIVLHQGSGYDILLTEGEIREGDEISIEDPADIHVSSDACLDQEAILDDIPTKLCPSEEELPQQLKEEQPMQISSDDALSQGEFVADNDEEITFTTLR